MTPAPRILVVDDEATIRQAVERNLSAHGYEVATASDGSTALVEFRTVRPALVILDLGLPDMEGTSVIREIRSESDVPIIVLTVRSMERDKVEALNLGADDYVTKPFGVEELLARVGAALRRSGSRSAEYTVFRTGELEVDIEHRRVKVGGKEIHLTPTEFNLLRAFVGAPDRVLTDRALLSSVWGNEYGDESHYLHVYMARLRAKIEPDSRHPVYLLTEPGVGYRLTTRE